MGELVSPEEGRDRMRRRANRRRRSVSADAVWERRSPADDPGRTQKILPGER